MQPRLSPALLILDFAALRHVMILLPPEVVRLHDGTKCLSTSLRARRVTSGIFTSYHHVTDKCYRRLSQYREGVYRNNAVLLPQMVTRRPYSTTSGLTQASSSITKHPVIFATVMIEWEKYRQHSRIAKSTPLIPSKLAPPIKLIVPARFQCLIPFCL